MKWATIELPIAHRLYITEENNDISIIYGSISSTTKEDRLNIRRAVLCHNFCEEFTDEELEQMQSLKSFQILTKAYGEGVVGMLEDVRDDSIEQVKLLQEIRDWTLRLAIDDRMAPALKIVYRIERYFQEKNIHYES